MEVEGTKLNKITLDAPGDDPREACLAFLNRFPGYEIKTVGGEPIDGLCEECNRPIFEDDERATLPDGLVCVWCGPSTDDPHATQEWDAAFDDLLEDSE